MTMNDDQFDRQVRYEMVLHTLSGLLSEGLITREEHDSALAEAVAEYDPIILHNTLL